MIKLYEYLQTIPAAFGVEHYSQEGKFQVKSYILCIKAISFETKYLTFAKTFVTLCTF